MIICNCSRRRSSAAQPSRLPASFLARLILAPCRWTRHTRQRARPSAADYLPRRLFPARLPSSSRYLSCLFPLRIRPLMRALRDFRCSLSTAIPGALRALFSLLTSDRSSERRGGTRRDDAGEGGATRATAATSASAAPTAATAVSRCKESCARERPMAKSRGQACYEKKKNLGGKGRKRERERRETYLRGTEERPETDSEASQRRQDRRRQPAITSWNVWERVGLDPKGPTTTKSLLPRLLASSPFHPFFHQRVLRAGPTLYKVTPGGESTPRPADRAAISPRSHRVLSP